ncbi:unnamed protein product [Prorocentrum cordatum]|nr:unnamed protein product [Polarella glacialis]
MPLEDFVVVSADPSVAVAEAFLEVNGGGSEAAVGAILPPLVADVVYTCRRAGAARLAAQFRFRDPRLAPVELSLVKRCAADARGGLSLGTAAELAPDVVRDGASMWAPTTALQRIVPADTERLVLYWTFGHPGEQEAAQPHAAQALAAPSAAVTPLELQGEPVRAGPAQVRRWSRRLLQRSAQETHAQSLGSWGLPQDGAASAQSVLRVAFAGALASGGQQPLGSVPAGAAGTKIAVELECVEVGTALVEVQIAPLPLYQPHRPAVIAFVKQCGWTALDGVDVSTHPLEDGDALPDIVSEGTVLKDLPELGPQNATATVYWDSLRRGLGPPDATTVDCGDGPANASVEVLEDSSGSSGHMRLHLTCRGEGRATCAMRFGWRLHRGPVVRFAKACSPPGRAASIESLMQRRLGALTPERAVTPVLCHGSAASLSSSAMEVPADAFKVICTFFPNASVGLSAAEVSVADPEVVHVVPTGSLAFGGEVDPHIGGNIELDLSCLQSGSSNVQVVLQQLPASSAPPVVFSFSKRCQVSRLQHLRNQPYLIALVVYGGLLLASVAMVIGLLANFRAVSGKISADI